MTIENRWIRQPHQGNTPASSGGSLHAVVVAKRRDKVCSEFDKDTEIEQLRETLAQEYGKAGSAEEKLDAKLKVVRHLKRLLRCEGSYDAGVDEVSALAPGLVDEVVASAQTVLGGHLAAWAPWTGIARDAFVGLGATEAPPLVAHEIPPIAHWGPGTAYDAKVHRKRSKKSEQANTRILKRAHILGCRGHHYTSHLAPGFFTNGTTSMGIDLRYNLHANPQGFPRLAVMAVSGCSMICELAQRMLKPCFPRARFLGSRNTMTMDAGDYIWPKLPEKLFADGTPLLLDNTQDIEQFTQSWYRANVYAMHEEAIRLLKDKKVKLSTYRIRAKQTQLIKNIGPGFADGDETVQLIDRHMSNKRLPLTSEHNECESKEDDRATLVPPNGFVLPQL